MLSDADDITASWYNDAYELRRWSGNLSDCSELKSACKLNKIICKATANEELNQSPIKTNEETDNNDDNGQPSNRQPTTTTTLTTTDNTKDERSTRLPSPCTGTTASLPLLQRLWTCTGELQQQLLCAETTRQLQLQRRYLKMLLQEAMALKN